MTTCIDLFSGAGGFSTGARMAGLDVVWAANHWPAAVKVHAANHPDAIHVCQDLFQADWTKVPKHDVLAGSPCCQGHSRARGKDRPHHDASRSTAWALVSAAEFHRPSTVTVENVIEFSNWALFPAWCAALEALGYTLSAEVLDASRFGVPQIRKRLFIVGTRGKKPFDFYGLGNDEQRPISDVLELDSGDWRPWDPAARKKAGIRPLVAATMERILAGRKQFGDKTYWIPYFSANRRAWGIDQPIWTITTRDRYALVQGDMFRFLSVNEIRRAMGFPADYCLTGNRKTDIMLLGNAVVPQVAAQLFKRLAAA